jgi:hypothetical protein
MAMSRSSATAAADKRRPPRWLGLVCATALTSAMTLGLGVWQLHDQAGGYRQEPVRPATTTHTGVTRPAPSDARGSRALYLVASEEQAVVMRQHIEEGNAVRAQVGQRPLNGSVLATEGLDPAVVFVAADMFATMVPDGVVVDLQTP